MDVNLAQTNKISKQITGEDQIVLQPLSYISFFLLWDVNKLSYKYEIHTYQTWESQNDLQYASLPPSTQ